MNDEVTFLPWVRRGLAHALENADPLSGALDRGPGVDAWVEIEGERVERRIRLRGPEAVVGITGAQVLREEPRPDSADVEPNYFALVELAAPDLPWMYTPAAADAQGRLRPWLVLVVVREQEGVTIATRAQGSLPVLRIAAPAVPANELPDLADSWAWAHVHSIVATDDVDVAVTGRSGEVFARFVSPRRLLPDCSWLACLVPAFDVGLATGLGETLPEGDDIQPAWALAELGASIELPLYHYWRFGTGAEGDFEALCRRLQPDEEGAVMGLHALDVTDPGLVTPAETTVIIDMEGALETLEADPGRWDAGHKEQFQTEVVDLLDEGVARAEVTPPGPNDAYDPATQDPVVAPPMYGTWPAGVTAVPDKGWLRTVNDHPARRGAAGLGGRVVRKNQEALVAAAWDQAGDLRATTAALNRGRLAAEIGRSWTRRAAALDDADLLQLTSRVHAFVPDGTRTVRASLVQSAVPGGLVSAAYLRQTRPSTPLARDWRQRAGGASPRLSTDHTRTNVEATAPAASVDVKTALDFARIRLPAGAQIADETLTREVAPPDLDSDPVRRAEIEGIVRLGQRSRTAGPQPAPEAAEAATGAAAAELPDTGAAQTASVDVSALGDAVRIGLDPLASVRASVLLRIPALDGLLAEGTLPTVVPLGPVFEDPLYWDLLALGASWIMPGADSLGANRVRLVAVNTSFVGAFLIGANHELGRELLWRDYPVDLRATFFHRFWSYVDPARTDIDDLHTWDPDLNIRDNIDPQGETMTVMVVRGDLVRRYPTAHYFMQEATLDAEGEASPVEGSVMEASFVGSLDHETVFYGFDLTPEEARGDRPNGTPGWFLAIEEQPGAPRLGLDVAKERHFSETPKRWNNLSWGHLVTSQAELDTLTHATADNARIGGLTLEDTTWGFNSAHIARASWQRPFRMLIHADVLV